MDDYFDLGAFHMPITTTSEEAQTWFDRGLAWCYGFNHEEALLCFRKALEHDPDCTMAHWGVAYASGPNYNKLWVDFGDAEREECLARARAAGQQGPGVCEPVRAMSRRDLPRRSWRGFPMIRQMTGRLGTMPMRRPCERSIARTRTIRMSVRSSPMPS